MYGKQTEANIEKSYLPSVALVYLQYSLWTAEGDQDSMILIYDGIIIRLVMRDKSNSY